MSDNDQAVIMGTFSDLKFIKGRKVIQIVIECPIESGSLITKAFGTPDPSQEVWIALARLTQDAVKNSQQPDQSAECEPPARFHSAESGKSVGGPLCRSAAILCNDIAFRRFVSVQFMDNETIDAVSAADFVRIHCGVDSRREIDGSPTASQTFIELRDAFVSDQNRKLMRRA
jgi:hypothetical protein